MIKSEGIKKCQQHSKHVKKHLAPSSLQHMVSEQSSVESEHCPGGGVVKAGHGSGSWLGMASPRNMARTKCPDFVSSP